MGCKFICRYLYIILIYTFRFIIPCQDNSYLKYKMFKELMIFTNKLMYLM